MYKSRIWKWGLDKKLKSDEVLAILILKQERDAQRKPTQFTIRGQPVDLDNINRYIKRNPLLVARFRAGQVPSVQTSHEVSCYTPPPSPTRSLPPPGESQRVDEVLRLYKDYVEGSFASFAWDWQYDVSCVGRVPGDRSEELFERVIGSFALVNRCFSRGDKISVEAVLNPAFESLREIVAAESPILVVRTVCLLWYLEHHRKHDLLRLVMDYLGSLIPIILGQHHVLARVWHIFSTTQFSDYHQLAMCLYSMLIPLMEQRLGPANYLTTLLYGDHIDCLFQQNRSSDALTLATRYRTKVDATGQRHPWLVELAITQTAVICAGKEANGLIGEAMECLQTLKRYPMTEDQMAVVDVQMGNYSYRLGDIRGAISSYRRAARLAITVGCDERLLTTCLTNLEIALNKEGWVYEAIRVKDYKLKRIDDFASEASDFAKRPYVTQPSFTRNDALPDFVGSSDVNKYVSDDSWLWQDSNTVNQGGSGSDLLKDMQLGPIDPSMRWVDYPTVSDSWTRSAPLSQPAMVTGPISTTTTAAAQYSTLAPLMSDTWQPDIFR